MKRTVHYIPHTHYDAEVFLTRDETFEIGYSVMTNVLSRMEADPRFKFAIDQTCYIEPLLRAYPELCAGFRNMVAQKRLEVTCGMHAMPDVNIPSGESFIRQVISGKSWCRKELGLDVRCGWLLDTFGQHPQIPQLMVKCGFDHNLFQRLGEIDSPTEFWWKGIDGTELFCHWMRGSYAVLYGAPGSLHEFRKFALRHLKELNKNAATDHILALSGADLSDIQPHVADLFEQYNSEHDDFEFTISTPQEYFDAIKPYSKSTFPVCSGDKNPVFQGCFSARIAVKLWNRKMETLLANAELADAAATALGAPTCAQTLARAWEPVLFNQFHDIICGSHVDKVYNNVIDRFKSAHVIASECLQNSFDALVSQIDTSGMEPGIPVVVFNPLSWDRDDVVECRVAFTQTDVHEIEVQDSTGTAVPFDILSCERYGTGGIKRATVLFIAQNVPSLGYEVYVVTPAVHEPLPGSLSSNQPEFLMADNFRDVIENEFFSLEIDAWNGAIRSLYDKTTDWEFIPVDRPYGGTIVRELDNGNFWEYNGHCKGDALQPMNRLHPLPEEGDSRAAFSHHYGGDGRVINGRARTDYVVNFAFGGGFFATRIRIYAGLPRIDIKTTLINSTERVRYRMAVPTTLHNGKIVHEIPFGAIERPEGEFAVQNWIDYHDNARGLAILNKGMPGCQVQDNVMMLSLLKCTALKEGYGEGGGWNNSTKTTDGYELDVRHEFEYALAPHIGDWRDAKLVRRGLEFNRPLISRKAEPHAGDLPKRLSLFNISDPNVVVSAVKTAEDGRGFIVRLYESCGWETSGVTISCATPFKSVNETNLIEDDEDPVKPLDSKRFAFDIKPFEIRTFRIV